MSYGSTNQKRLFYSVPAPVKNLISSVYGWKQKRARQGAIYERQFQFLEESQWQSNDWLHGYQVKMLKSFLIEASRRPFFNALFERSGFRPEQLSDLTCLQQLPILTKEILRNNLEGIADHSGDLHWVNTSGTTGLGLRFPETKESFQREYAFRFQNYSCGGIHFGDRWAMCAGHPVVAPERSKPPFWVHDHSSNWLLMSSYHLKEENLKSYIQKLQAFRPQLIGGYPSSVYMLALANQHFGGQVAPKAVYTASETLFDFQRKAIEQSFGCKAYTYYGNAERCGFIAECEQGSLHVKAEHSVVELLDENNRLVAPGTPGRLVCTGFGNYATPFIRYEVGDVAVASATQTCKCGRNGLILDSLEGRTEDYVVTPDGRFVGRLDHLFKDAIAVRMAQIIQDKREEITIHIVKEPQYGASDEEAILKEARNRLGCKLGIKIVYVKDIERTGTGKFPFIVSSINKSAFGRILERTGASQDQRRQ